MPGTPAIVLPGARFGKGAWWPEMTGALGGLGVTSDEFFAALDSLGEARGRRAVVIIDAVNESESPGRWKTELAALHAQVSRYPSCRRHELRAARESDNTQPACAPLGPDSVPAGAEGVQFLNAQRARG
jgi:hypothetical protein